jgi:molybdate transport system substrate-binding protein
MTRASDDTIVTEITVLCSVALQGVLEQLAPAFEGATGHKLIITFSIAKLFKERIEAGEYFDAGIFTNLVVDDLIKANKIVAGSRTNIARTGIGLAVHVSAPAPDIGTVAALEQTLLAAKSIVYPKDGISGIYFSDIVKRLGIYKDLMTKTILDTSSGLVAGRVASGEVQYAVQLISELMSIRGVKVVGPIPAELQRYVVVTAGISANAKEAGAAKEFLEFLVTPVALSVMKAKGLEPA